MVKTQETVISPANSFEGWSFGKWFSGNKKTLKELVKVGLPLLVSLPISDNYYIQLLIVIVGKLVLDSGEYFLKEKKA